MKKKLKQLKEAIKGSRFKEAFTMIEMLIVLGIVALLMVIIIPNISGQKQRIDKQANENITEIVTTQANAYYLVEGSGQAVTLEILVAEGYLTEKQAKEAETRIGDQLPSLLANP